MYSVFLSSYTNTRESLGELEKAVEPLACGSCVAKYYCHFCMKDFFGCCVLFNSLYCQILTGSTTKVRKKQTLSFFLVGFI